MRYLRLYILILIFGVILRLNLCGSVPIVGGQIVTSVRHSERYAFMVSLQDVLHSEDGSVRFKHFCGGNLITTRWILTAAHCVYRKNITQVVALIGYENIDDRDDLQRNEIERAEYIYFQPINYRNDIALILLKKAYNGYLGGDLHFARLPKPGMKANRTLPCHIIGYGATRHAGEVQTQLSEAKVYVIRNSLCRKIIGQIWAPQKGANTVCALGDNQDSCQGDSGGPMICQYDGSDYIYGLVSHGPTCGISGMPSIYTVTIPYVEWINLVIQRHKEKNSK